MTTFRSISSLVSPSQASKERLHVGRLGGVAGALVAAAVLGACAGSTPSGSGSGSGSGTPDTASATEPGGAGGTGANGGGRTGAGSGTGQGPKEVRTRNAVFKVASFGELPGWDKDDIRAGWSAFRYSCEPLQRREEWRDICAAAKTVAPTERAMRSFFESRFTVLRILNPDASREGDVTGYFEPLLEGQATRNTEYNVPVMGVPRDLFTLDWGKVPAAQRRAVIRVKPAGDRLVQVAATEPGSYAMDMRRFVQDDRDRRLRVRLVDSGATSRVEPYYTRAELDALGMPAGVNAPVLAWVNDPLALYAMQVQGSGRVLFPDGSILRLQYAEQNGHPFKPMRVVAKAKPVTRGAGGADAADDFVLEDGSEAPDTESAPEIVTRGGKQLPGAAPAAKGPEASGLVDELLKGAKPAPPARAAAPAPAPQPAARTQAVPSPAAAPTTARTPVATSLPTLPPAGAAARPKPAAPAAATGTASARQAAVQARLSTDPSFVFFKTVAERPRTEGPQGALGVPLTAGRSVAVDPRVTPLGYPMYLSAPPPKGSQVQVQRLVFAQDTGGAIRGALRADYFWGFGSEAGQLARSTRHRGQMWVMLPNGEASRLASSRLVTRGAAPSTIDTDGQCLIADGEFCSEVSE